MANRAWRPAACSFGLEGVGNPEAHTTPPGKRSEEDDGPSKSPRPERGCQTLRRDPRRLLQARLRAGPRVGSSPATTRQGVLRARGHQPEGADRGKPVRRRTTLRAGRKATGGRAGARPGNSANLSGADLRYAHGMSNEELEDQAASLEGAIMPNAQW